LNVFFSLRRFWLIVNSLDNVFEAGLKLHGDGINRLVNKVVGEDEGHRGRTLIFLRKKTKKKYLEKLFFRFLNNFLKTLKFNKTKHF
jgi:hypothetical protein